MTHNTEVHRDAVPQRPIGAATAVEAIASSARIGVSPITAASAALSESIPRLAAERGRLRAAEQPDSTAIAQLDLQLSRVLDDVLPHLSSARDLRAATYARAKELHEVARLTEAERILCEHSLGAGLAQGRVLDQAELDRHRAAIARYRATHSDLFTRYPGFSEQVETMCAAQERKGITMRLDADKVAMTISIALRRFMPDVRTLNDALSSKTPLELRLIKEAFQQRYGEPIESFIESTFSRPGLGIFLPVKAMRNRALHLLENDHISATADALFLAIASKFKKPFGGIVEILRNTPAGLLHQVPDAFRRLYSDDAPKFERALSKFSATERLIIDSLIEGRSDEANALAIKNALSGPPSKMYIAYRTLEAAGRDARYGIHVAFNQLFAGQSFDAAVANMPEGAVKDRVRAFLSGDLERQRAAIVRCALEDIGEETIVRLFEGMDLASRREHIRSFEQVYHREFLHQAKEWLRPADHYYIEALCQAEQAPKAEIIWHCVDGLGTDELGIKHALSGMTELEIASLRSDYAKLSAQRRSDGMSENLDARLKRETSGDAWHDIKRLLRGIPENLDELHDRIAARHRHERSGPWIRRVDLISREGGVMDRDVAIACEYYETHIKHRNPSADEKCRFETLARYASRDMLGFRITKNDWSDFIANTGSTALAIATLLPLAPVTHSIESTFLRIAALGAMAGLVRGAGRLGMKAMLKGDGYGREEIVRDSLITAAEASTAFLSRFLPISLLRRPIDIGAKMGLKAIIRLGETNDLERVPAHAFSLRDLHRAFDDDHHIAQSDHAPLDIAALADCADGLCSLHALDHSFEQSLRQL